MEYNEKQIKIIETAERMFADNGFEGTSVRDIARESDVNVAMISYYFGSKEKLMEAIVVHRINHTRLTIESILQNKEYTPFQKVESLVDSYLNKMIKNKCFYRLMQQEPSLRDIHKISELIYEAKNKNMELMKKIINEGQKTGDFKKNIDIQFMMVSMVGTANHYMIHDSYYKKVNGLEDLSDEDFFKHLKKKLSHNLKTLFKAYLTYEA